MGAIATWFAPAVATGLIMLAGCSTSPPGSSSNESASHATAAASLPRLGTYAIDSAHTFINFTAQHKVVGRVHGRFERMAGTVVVAQEKTASSVDISIEAGSLTTQNSIRDEDLRSADFFDAAAHPMIKYHGKGIRESGEGWVVDGNLTIRGMTKAVPLSFVFMGTAPAEAGKPSRVAFHATAAVKRADFGMTRDLLIEIGTVSASPDVWITIDAELLGADAGTSK